MMNGALDLPEDALLLAVVLVLALLISDLTAADIIIPTSIMIVRIPMVLAMLPDIPASKPSEDTKTASASLELSVKPALLIPPLPSASSTSVLAQALALL